MKTVTVDREDLVSAVSYFFDADYDVDAVRMAFDRLRAALQQPAANNHRATLPYITDRIWEQFNDTCLMTWSRERNRPDWSQLAVDFACVIEAVESAKGE